jgi:hypothetical protein
MDMSKSLAYWRGQWESSTEREAAWKTLALLAEYAAFFKYLPFTSLNAAWGGTVGRFFSGRWNTHHGNEVQDAISSYFFMDGYYSCEERFHTVEFVLAVVKKKLANRIIDQDGDLAKILSIVKEKTSVDYFRLDADAIYNAYTNSSDKSHGEKPVKAYKADIKESFRNESTGSLMYVKATESKNEERKAFELKTF